MDGSQIIFYAASMHNDNGVYSASVLTSMNAIKSLQLPALTAIEIEAEQTEVTVPYSTEITVKSITPANAVFENVEWLTSDETKATVSGDTKKATVTSVATGEVKISAKCGNVTSNEITLTLVADQSETKFILDWTEGWSDDFMCNYTNIHYGLPTTDIVQSYINKWSPEQNEILTMNVSAGYHIGDDKPGIGLWVTIRNKACDISLTTVHQIRKITFKVIPYDDAKMVQFTINGKEFNQEKGSSNWDGKIANAIDAEVELNEASNTLNFAKTGTTGNSYAIVGMTLEW